MTVQMIRSVVFCTLCFRGIVSAQSRNDTQSGGDSTISTGAVAFIDRMSDRPSHLFFVEAGGPGFVSVNYEIYVEIPPMQDSLQCLA